MLNYTDYKKENLIIFEDNNIIVCNKPFGMLSCEDKKRIDTNLFNFIKTEKSLKNLAIINRLDRGVGGLVIFSKNNKYTSILTEYMKNHSFSKNYLAIVCGEAKDKDYLEDYLMKNQRLNISKIVNKNSSGAKKCILSYKKLSQIQIDNNTYSLIDVSLQTGRHHQIRAQLSNANLPLYNDIKYNKNIKRKIGNGHLGLFCYKMGFNEPITNEYLNFVIYPKNEEIFEKFLINYEK